MAGAGQIILIGVGSLLAIGCVLALVVLWDIRRQRRADENARLHRRLGHVRSGL